MKKVLVALFLTNLAFGQDAHFSQTDGEPLNVNPALAGMNGSLRSSLIYRNQWSILGSSYSTVGASADYCLLAVKSNSWKISIGLNILSDIIGEPALSTNLANVHLASSVKISEKGRISSGFFLGYRQLTLDQAEGEWASQFNGYTYDPSMQSGETFARYSLRSVNTGVGFVYQFSNREKSSSFYNRKEFNLGFSAYNLNRPLNSFMKSEEERLDVRYTMHGNGLFALKSSGLVIEPSFFLNRQGTFTECIYGSYLGYRFGSSTDLGQVEPLQVSVGLFYRNKDAIIPKILLRWLDLQVGLSYDLNNSTFQTATRMRGGIEFYIAYRIASLSKRFYGGSFN